MKVKTKKEFKEVVTKIYIAEDGTEFNDKVLCEKYENEQNENPFRFKLEEMEIKELRGMPPLDVNGEQISVGDYFKWYKLNDVEDVDAFDEIYGNGIVNPDVYPEVVCMEYGQSCDEEFNKTLGDCAYCHYLSDMKSETIGFWEHFGLKVNFEEVKEND